MADRSLKLLSKNRLDDWSIVGCIRCHVSIFGRRSVCQSFLRSCAAPTRRNQKNPGNRGKETGVNVSNGSSESARKNTASVSAEPTTHKRPLLWEVVLWLAIMELARLIGG